LVAITVVYATAKMITFPLGYWHYQTPRHQDKGADLKQMEKSALIAEKVYAESLSEPLEKAERIGEADIVVGIPFQNEVDTIGHVCKTAAKGLSEFFPDKKCVIVCVGAPEGEDALNVIQEVPLGRAINKIAFLMKNEGVRGKVSSLRAIIEIADSLNADLALFEAHLESRKVKAEIEGLAPEWVSRLLVPIEKEGIDLVIPKFNHHYLDAPATTHLVPSSISRWEASLEVYSGSQASFSEPFWPMPTSGVIKLVSMVWTASLSQLPSSMKQRFAKPA